MSPKVLGNAERGAWKKLKESMKRMMFLPFTVADLFNHLVVGVVLVHHEIAIVPLNIVSDDVDWVRFIQGQGIQPFDKLLHTLISSEAEGTIIVFGFGNHEIGHVMFLGLHGFDVKEHV